jgi:hypothetical protein
MHGYHNEPIQLVEERTIQNQTKKDGEALAESFLQDATEWTQAAIAISQEKQQLQANKTRTAAP